MGKSPGKWIKAVLFGKKTPKSNLAKGRESSKSTNEKAPLVSAKEPGPNLNMVPSMQSEPIRDNVAGRKDNNFEKGEAAKLPSDAVALSSVKQDEDVHPYTSPSLPKDVEKIKLEQAATKAQATFRGYLARRAFRALKGIIRLQAVIRGHLVRRQAVATLHTVHGIVKFQALVRGQIVRHSDIGRKISVKHSLELKDADLVDCSKIQIHNQAEMLAKNAFVRKLLMSSPSGVQVCLHYDLKDPNSAWEWLQRWTTSHVWIPDFGRNSSNSKCETSGRDITRSKQSLHVESGSNLTSSESEKPKRNLRKSTKHSVKPAQEHPQNEIEKVKGRLKRISNPTSDTSVRMEVVTERPKQIQRKSFNAMAPEYSGHSPSISNEKPSKVLEDVVPEPADVETIPEVTAASDLENGLHSHPASDIQIEKIRNGDEFTSAVDQDFKDDKLSNECERTSSRRSSLPAKHDDENVGLPTTRRVPSYMAATESAKAKARGQVSPRFEQEVPEKNGVNRRHSLPSSVNGKLSSSPRVLRLVQATGRGGTKIDRSLTSSRDGNDKVIQAEWRR